MPIYEYECRTCGVRFERKQSVYDAPVELCPECGGPVRKVFHPAGIIFKGSGFYKTDYGSSSSSTESGNGKSESSSTAKSESKTDTAKSEPVKAETKKD